MHRQDDGVADDVAYHHVAHHFAGHDDMWQHKMEAVSLGLQGAATQ